MSLRFLNWILTAAIWVAGLAVIVALGVYFFGATPGKPASVSFPVTLGPSEPTEVLLRDGKTIIGKLMANEGRLEINLDGSYATILLIVHTIILAGVWLCILIVLRRLVIDITSGNPFAPKASSRLRLMGWLLIGCNIYAFVMNYIPLLPVSDWMLADGRILLDSPAMFGVPNQPYAKVILGGDGGSNAWMALTGLILLALAEAFRIGRKLQVDGEGII